jgi:hypothetical protein
MKDSHDETVLVGCQTDTRVTNVCSTRNADAYYIWHLMVNMETIPYERKAMRDGYWRDIVPLSIGA